MLIGGGVVFYCFVTMVYCEVGVMFVVYVVLLNVVCFLSLGVGVYYRFVQWVCWMFCCGGHYPAVSKLTCFQLLINTNVDPDTQPLQHL